VEKPRKLAARARFWVFIAFLFYSCVKMSKVVSWSYKEVLLRNIMDCNLRKDALVENHIFVVGKPVVSGFGHVTKWMTTLLTAMPPIFMWKDLGLCLFHTGCFFKKVLRWYFN